MATRFLVRFATKGAGTQPQERIVAIGGLDPHGKLWTLTSIEAITGVENGEWVFFALCDGGETEVVVGVTAQGRKYLKAARDMEQPDTLMKLPPFAA